jgi:dipeptidyl-peptidase-4
LHPSFKTPTPLKKLVTVLLLTPFLAGSVLAQKKKLSLEESLTNPAFGMSIRQLHGFQDGAYAEVVTAPGKGDVLVKRLNDKTDTLLFASAWQNGKKNFPRLNWKSSQFLYGMMGTELSTYNLETKKAALVATLPEEAENQDVEEKSLFVAFTKEQNLFIQKGAQAIQVTNETDKNIVCGQSVHRNEYGINKGTFWSPDGNQLAFYRMDQRMVTDYPIVEITEKPAKVRNIKYPMAGQTSHEVTLGVYNLANQKTTFLDVTGPKDQYLTGITWTTDSKYITITLLNRETNHFQLNAYDAASGKLVKTLFDEKSDRYLDPQEGPLFVNAALDFVWQSERNGFNHLYLYGWDGKLKKQLSSGNEKVTDVLGSDDKGQNLLFIQTGGQGMDRIVKSVDLKSAKVKSLTPTSGVHNAMWCEGKTRLLDVWSNLKTPKQIDLIDVTGKAPKMLRTFANPFADYDFPSIDTLSLKSSDGQTLHARLIKPTNFDPNKKYPVIVYLYGGPHAQMVTNSWLAAANVYMAAWAADGFVVFTIDNRGSYNRGVAFEQAPHRNLGTPEMEDQLAGVKYLKSLPYVDGTRLGIHGWSYGGFMTTTMMSRAPGTFKVGIAGAPVIDWAMYEIMYTERYMDTPKENPQGYETANLVNHAQNVKGKFMLIHGTSDDVVVWQNTQAFLKKAIESGVQLDYFIYPGHGHGVGGKDRIHLMKKMTNYFKDNL